MHRANSARGSTSSQQTGWSPKQPTRNEKDVLIDKLVHDNEVLMKEITELDSRLRAALEGKQEAVDECQRLVQDRYAAENSSDVSQRLIKSSEEQVNYQAQACCW